MFELAVGDWQVFDLAVGDWQVLVYLWVTSKNF